MRNYSYMIRLQTKLITYVTWRITHRSTRVASDETVLGWKLGENLPLNRQLQSLERSTNSFPNGQPEPFERITIFSNGYPKPFERMTTFFKRMAQVLRTDDNLFQMGQPKSFERMTIFFERIPPPSRSNRYQIRSKTANRKERFRVRGHTKGLTKYVRYVH